MKLKFQDKFSDMIDHNKCPFSEKSDEKCILRKSNFTKFYLNIFYKSMSKHGPTNNNATQPTTYSWRHNLSDFILNPGSISLNQLEKPEPYWALLSLTGPYCHVSWENDPSDFDFMIRHAFRYRSCVLAAR